MAGKKTSNKIYEGAGKSYKEANKALRKNAAADGVKIRQSEIMYQCGLTFKGSFGEGFGSSDYGGERRLYRDALSSMLKVVNLSAGIFRVKRNSGECKLEVIASGPHREYEPVEGGEELKPAGCAYMESGTKLTDLF